MANPPLEQPDPEDTQPLPFEEKPKELFEELEEPEENPLAYARIYAAPEEYSPELERVMRHESSIQAHLKNGEGLTAEMVLDNLIEVTSEKLIELRTLRELRAHQQRVLQETAKGAWLGDWWKRILSS